MRLVIMGQDLQRGIVENKVARSRLGKPFRRCDGEGFPEVAFSSVVVGGEILSCGGWIGDRHIDVIL